MPTSTRSTAARVLAAFVLALGGIAILPAGAHADQRAPESRDSIFISGDTGFNATNGIRGGTGTKKDPYVISNWSVSSMEIKDTSKYVVIKNNQVFGQMILDWNGANRVTVVKNDVGDLRVNQNVPRKGDATGGRIAHNKFGFVGQLRHFDGIFEKNVIGSEDVLNQRGTFEAVQFDGFHGARFRNNKIYGFVDVKLHGHHHGSGYKKGSHYHGGSGDYGDEQMSGGHDNHKKADHTKRYHQLFFSGNKIFSDGPYAVRYYDRDHTADDRTNASETNKLLNCPHVHFTRVHITNNDLRGAGVLVDVFNAHDDNHWGTKTGLVEVSGNRVTVERDVRDVGFGRHGITVQEARDVKLHIMKNTISGADMVQEEDLLKLEKNLNTGAGIRLMLLEKAKVHLGGNKVSHRDYGIWATGFPRSVKWWVHELRTADVEKPIFYDSTVHNPPNQG